MEIQLILLIFLTIIQSIKCGSVINMTAYYRIPPLYKLDDYDRCLNEFSDRKTIYCYVDVTIAPNRSNIAWQYIERISADRKHYFRHDRLNRGVCINRCAKLFENFVYAAKQLWFQPLTFDRHYTMLDRGVYRNALYYRNRYNRLVNICVNRELKPHYELMAYSEILYCDSRNSNIGDADYPIDDFDKLFLIIVAVILLLTVISSFIDHRLNKRNKRPDHFQSHNQSDRYMQIILSFSIYRNCYKIMSEKHEEIKVINAMRFLFMFTIVLGHTILVFSIIPVANPEYVEENFHRMVTMLLINGANIIQTYYTISGFLVAFKFHEYMDKFSANNGKLVYVVKGIVIRYFRLTPVYAFMILFNATWLLRLDTGPIWRYGNEQERNYCRTNWWTNLLFINNYVKSSEPCLQQGWYLGTDFQLFVIFMCLLNLVTKFPQVKKFVLFVCIAVSVVVPGWVTYVYKFDGILTPFPESAKYALWYDEMYKYIYIPTHTNTGSYLAGIIGGWIWYRIRRDQIDIKTNKIFKFLYPYCIPSAVIFLMSGYIFYAFEFDKPAIWISCYSALAKNFWGIIISTLIIGVSSGIGGVIKDILNIKMFNILGHITFCTYFVHVGILRLSLSNLRQPNTLSDTLIFVYVSSACLLSYLVGFLVCLFVEVPCSNLLKLFVTQNIDEGEKKLEEHALNNLETIK